MTDEEKGKTIDLDLLYMDEADLVDEIMALRAVLKEVEEYLDDRANDGAYGRPVPNSAMRMLRTVRAVLKVKGA